MDFIHRTTEEIARDLLGVRVQFDDGEQTYAGYIVETEAYLGDIDQAAHTYNGRNTPRVQSMYKDGGTIYAHVMHTHLLINFVTQPAGTAQGVLIRALEPETITEQMKENRNGKDGIDLTNGPGKWTRAFNMTMALDGFKLNEGPLKIDTKQRRYPVDIVESPRIGIPNKGEWTHKPLRFTVEGNPYVSRMRKSEMKPAQETWKD
ncbi:DNA-3-methyladenine glycosylase [Staphylococcus simulans]|uniref:DNA-3-methyladenine glycosylase n=1 Tax=Staphylococcus simulans TaxID=1286 RepID=UPI000D1FB4C0|nr:DNA-3-methyladenine glycosylase [Staphylococcus simulans]MDY5061281.1 DNA-3-methyladenine glycosylase [Staphylococcus simulans]PTJ18181.1 3-methyladenine DNA glycosylase [Staphylococcus simulans]RIN78291.1 DNA-3-methyladenine glycosylase [Staphylococcus simulans]